MTKKVFKDFSKKEREQLFTGINFLNVKEITNFCKTHRIPLGEKKGLILQRIKYYLLTGEILLPKTLLIISKAKRNVKYPLKPTSKTTSRMGLFEFYAELSATKSSCG